MGPTPGENLRWDNLSWDGLPEDTSPSIPRYPGDLLWDDANLFLAPFSSGVVVLDIDRLPQP